MDNTKYIGMDVHTETISIAVLNSAGKLVMESVIETYYDRGSPVEVVTQAKLKALLCLEGIGRCCNAHPKGKNFAPRAKMRLTLHVLPQ